MLRLLPASTIAAIRVSPTIRVVRTGLALAALALPSAAQAQVLIGMLLGGKLASETFNIGFEIGMQLPTIDGLNGASRTRGMLLGLFASWRFSEHVHLFVGLTPLSNKGAEGANPVPLNDPELDALVGGGTMDRGLGYVDIPVLLQWAPQRNHGIRLGIGPQFAFLTSAHDRYNTQSRLGTAVTVEQDISNQLNNVDAGIALDAEYRFNGLPLAISIRYYDGRTNILRNESGPSMYNRVLSGSGRISLGTHRPASGERSARARGRG